MTDKTIKATSVEAQKTKPNVNTNLQDFFYAVLRWIQVNIVPIVALPILGILAADDIKIHLAVANSAHHSIEYGLLVGIAVAALLVVSVGSNKHQ